MGDLRPMKILSEVQYFNLSTRFGQVFSAGIGAEAVRGIFEKMDVQAEIEKIEEQLENAKESFDKKKTFQRIKFFRGMQKADVRLEWMLPTFIPVIPRIFAQWWHLMEGDLLHPI